MQPVQFYLDKETYKKLKHAVIEEDLTVTEAVRQAVALWMKEFKRRQKGRKEE